MKVDPEAWPIVSRLMDEWLDLPPERREEWLANLGPEYAKILPILRELLSQPEPDFLSNLPEIGEEFDSEPLPTAEAQGALVGAYRLVRELGHGGMGVVWLASRSDGTLKRDVAIKFPHFYLNNQTLTDRFVRERDILARLTDARIARLYDAGVTAQGQPYLVLEYVDGEPITVYCDRLCQDIRARLKLFLEVLRAVQYAHENLIVHRDLKPSNILVTTSGGVRLLDFGIAKLLEEGEARESEITRLGGRAVTPDFASPEQMAGGAITTATDVYSLGILFYELLTGGRPYKLQRDASGGMTPGVLTADPARPSQFAKAEEKAAARGATVTKLDAELRGDLDTIALKAIQKDPQARYATADAFAQDIERYLGGQPVLAQPESAWYRTKKFVLRNRLPVGATMAIALALASGAGLAVWQKRRADTEAATARAVSEFLRNDVLAQVGAGAQIGSGSRPDPDLKVRTALDRAAARIPGKFDAQPAVEAAIRQTLGAAYLNLSLYAEAQRHMERAVELRRRVLGAAHVETIGNSEELAEIYRVEGKYSQAEALLTNLLEIQHRLKRDLAPETFAITHELAFTIVTAHGDYARAETLYEKNLVGQRRVLGETNPLTLATMNNLGALLVREGKFARAEDLYQKLVETKRRAMGADHPSTLTTMNGLGVLYRNQGKYPEAEATLKATLAARRRVLGEYHRDTLSSGNALGLVYVAEGKFDEAEPLLSSVVEANRRTLGEKAPDTLVSVNSLAELYRRSGRLAQAEALFRLLLDAYRASDPDGQFTRGALVSLARVKLQQASYAQSAMLSRQAVEGYQKANSDSWGKYFADCLLGRSLARLGKHSEAEPLLTAGYRNLLQRQALIPFDYRATLDEARQWTEDETARLRQ